MMTKVRRNPQLSGLMAKISKERQSRSLWLSTRATGRGVPVEVAEWAAVVVEWDAAVEWVEEVEWDVEVSEAEVEVEMVAAEVAETEVAVDAMTAEVVAMEVAEETTGGN